MTFRNAAYKYAQILGISLLLSVASVTFASAQTPEDMDSDGYEDEDFTDEVIVEGQRSAASPIAHIIPDTVFGSGDIQSLGVTDIGELIEALAAETGGDSSEPPIILLDGRPVASRREIRSFPSEAVRRVEILPPEAALKYSSDPNRRVMNFVLRRRFNAKTLNAHALTTTDGGGNTYEAGANYLLIRNKTRLALNASYTTANHISEAERDIEDRNAGRFFARDGNVLALNAGNEIDPELSALAGDVVTIAGVPSLAMNGRPELGDFVATANNANIDDQRFFRDLEPETETLILGASLFKPVGERLSVSGAISADLSESDSARGLVSNRLIIPQGNPFSPFENDVALHRYDGPLTRHSSSDDIATSLSVFADYPDWRWSLEGQFNSVSDNRETERSTSRDALQGQISANDPALNPFGPLPVSAMSISDRTENTVLLKGLVSGQIMSLPAGDVSGTAGLEYSDTSLDTTSSFDGEDSSAALSRGTWQARAELDIPVFGKRGGRRTPGQTRLRLSGAIDAIENYDELSSYGAGLSHNLTNKITLQGSVDYAERAPNMAQLGDPILLESNVRVTDFATGTAAFVDRISGGNPDLLPERRRNVQITAGYRPDRSFKLTSRYRSRKSENAISGFPFLTPQVAASFPDRLIRDANGTLTEIDARAINSFETRRDSLRTGLNWSKRFTKRATTDTPPAATASPQGGPRRGRGRNRNSDRIALSFYHTWRLKDEVQFSDGGPVFDLLDGAAIRRRGGQSAHDIEARFSFKRKNVGGALFLNHESGSYINVDSLPGQQGSGGDLTFDPLTTANLRLYYDLGLKPNGRKVSRDNWRRDLRVTLDINNLGNKRPTVTNALGERPLGYEEDALDPFGRTVKISVRKLFSSPNRPTQ